MPAYDFICEKCGLLVTWNEPTFPVRVCICGGTMRRIYTSPQIIIRYAASDYVAQAARGEATVPGMSTREVREVVDRWPKHPRRK